MKTILCLHSSADLYGSDRSLLRLVTGGLPHRFIVVLPYEGPLCELLRVAGVECRVFPLAVVRRNLMSPVGLVRLGWSCLRTVWFLRKLIAGKKVDLVLANTTAVLGGEVAAWLTRVPYYQYVREIIVSPRLVAKFFSWRARLADKVICVSHGTRDAFISHGRKIADWTIVVNNGIEVGKYLPEKAEKLKAQESDSEEDISEFQRLPPSRKATEDLRFASKGAEVGTVFAKAAPVKKCESSSSFLVRPPTQQGYDATSGSLFRSELGVSEQTVLIGAIGRISKFKGMDFFVEGAEEFLRQHPPADVRFVVVGSAFRESGAGAKVQKYEGGKVDFQVLLPAEEELVERIRKAENRVPNTESRITWLPFREDIVDVMHGLDIFVLPSMLPDPFPTVVLEAMICGKPVIGTNHGGVPEMISGKCLVPPLTPEGYGATSGSSFFVEEVETGILVKPGDVEAMASAMGVLVEDPELRRAMGEAGRKRVLEHFTSEKYMERIAEVLG